MFKFILTAAAALLLQTSVFAAEIPVDIRVNDDFLKVDSRPYIEEDTVFAPIRAISEALGGAVEWNADARYASIHCGGNEITLYADGGGIYLNGEKQSGKNPEIRNGRFMVPVRAISNLLGAEVDWNDEYRYVEVTADGIELPDSMTDHTYTHDDVYWLARIIHAESQGESFEGKLAVGDVILNRVESSEFPNTIYDVIFDRNYAIQFEPVANGTVYNTPGKDSIAAAKLAMTSESSIGDCLYFFSPKNSPVNWINKNREFYSAIGNHEFYL